MIKFLHHQKSLPHYRKLPRRVDDGEPTHRFESSKAYFKQIYIEAINIEAIKHCYGKLTKSIPPKRAACLLEVVNGTLEDACNVTDTLQQIILIFPAQQFS